ncbi:Hint domain-containing protein [Asaia krungthepensis]|uniref:Outer membrane protein n=1 Tax=Asaia krungthepensis NRIC 0535 TaxID=1307925 RepID=A0ABQ0Q6P7_9PROT|nr:Hint domain-containing protein [Asaia krungthepensis]GBQ93820.1 outer membrane protein [Asaia krungthepensis NRIC 0535]
MTITSSGSAIGAQITYAGGRYSVLSGATLAVQGAGTTVFNPMVSGFGNGPDNSGFLPGQSGGTNYPAVLVASAAGVASGATVGFGGVVMGANGGTAVGGTAFDSGSFVGANGGVVDGATIGSNGGVMASMVAGYGGGAGIVRNVHVQAGGYGLAGGGFTIKGQRFEGGGIISASRFDVGSTEILTSAGTDIGSVIGGTQIVSSAGVAMKSIFSAGTQQIFSAGLASGSIASAGGRIEVYSGGTGAALIIASGGSLHVNMNGRVNGVQIQAAAAATADRAAIISGATIAGGGTLTLNSGATLFNGVIAGTTSSGGVGGLLVLESGAVLSGVTSMGWKSRLDIDSVQYTSGAEIYYTNNDMMVLDKDGNLLWEGPVGGGTSAGWNDFHLERDPVDGSMIIVYDKCFLKGTMIRTPRGEVAVENLEVGDRVLAYVNGEEVARDIIWVGHRSTNVRQGLSDDEAGYPVRIKQGALSENVPHRDLLVTPEHAMFIDGSFIPARMLVNGRSIVYDRNIKQFDYYHIETDEHSVLWSEGALSESYLDTGDRNLFSRGSSVVRLLNAPARDWALHAAAPLRVEREFVEPVYVALSERADALGMTAVHPAAETTTDPDLHLVDDRGNEIRAIRVVNRSHLFMLPTNVSGLRLVSRTARPVDMIGSFVDDRRHLGVMVGEIQIWEAGQTRSLDAHLTSETLAGWTSPEAGITGRWTSGNAELPPIEVQAGGTAMLSIEIVAGGPYPVMDKNSSLEAIAG